VAQAVEVQVLSSAQVGPKVTDVPLLSACLLSVATIAKSGEAISNRQRDILNMDSLKVALELVQSGQDEPYRIWVLLPGGMLIGEIGTPEYLAERFSILTKESVGDFNNLVGDPSETFIQDTTEFFMVNVVNIPSGVPLPLAKVSVSHVGAWGEAQFLTNFLKSKKLIP